MFGVVVDVPRCVLQNLILMFHVNYGLKHGTQLP